MYLEWPLFACCSMCCALVAEAAHKQIHEKVQDGGLKCVARLFTVLQRTAALRWLPYHHF